MYLFILTIYSFIYIWPVCATFGILPKLFVNNSDNDFNFNFELSFKVERCYARDLLKIKYSDHGRVWTVNPLTCNAVTTPTQPSGFITQ